MIGRNFCKAGGRSPVSSDMLVSLSMAAETQEDFKTNNELVDYLIERHYLSTPSTIEFFPQISLFYYHFVTLSVSVRIWPILNCGFGPVYKAIMTCSSPGSSLIFSFSSSSDPSIFTSDFFEYLAST